MGPHRGLMQNCVKKQANLANFSKNNGNNVKIYQQCPVKNLHMATQPVENFCGLGQTAHFLILELRSGF